MATKKSPDISIASPDIIRKILLQNSDLRDVFNLCKVNKYLARYVCTEEFWRLLADQRFNIKNKTHNTWKNTIMSLLDKTDIHSYFVLSKLNVPKTVDNYQQIKFTDIYTELLNEMCERYNIERIKILENMSEDEQSEDEPWICGVNFIWYNLNSDEFMAVVFSSQPYEVIDNRSDIVYFKIKNDKIIIDDILPFEKEFSYPFSDIEELSKDKITKLLKDYFGADLIIVAEQNETNEPRLMEAYNE